jgi:uncharacterized membrane protein
MNKKAIVGLVALLLIGAVTGLVIYKNKKAAAATGTTPIGGTGLETAPSFNEVAYLAANPDVAQAVRAGEFISGYQHYTMHGQYEGRKLG